jgi:myxalamid-type polyketide synthase MxaD
VPPNIETSTVSSPKLALMARQWRQQHDDAWPLRSEPIAIIGMGCRFPGGANDPSSYWEILAEGTDAISRVPADRWDADAYFDADPNAAGKMNTRWGGFLNGVDKFDPIAFGIAPSEAPYIDPQQRLLLEVAWEAFDDAGYPLASLSKTHTGVFFALYGNDYARLQLQHPADISAHTASGTAASIGSGRLSYLFNLRGPSIVVDTACSSSLVAVHMAVQSLRDGESSLAVAGGVSLILAPEVSVSLAKWGMLAADGRCKTFDASADGFVRGEGCGAVVMKRLADAIGDGDRVHAVIRGSAVNQDGRSSVLTAPNGEAQKTLIRDALKQARVRASDISFVETHGTGTKVGDPIEVDALVEVLGEPRPEGRPCYLGAVKANIGHLEAAAGIAGLIKAALCLRQRQIPRQIHFEKLNPLINLDGTALRIPTRNTPWEVAAPRRFAGVSSFGFSGTNAHLVLEEAPSLPETRATEETGRAQLLAISAKTAEGVAGLVDAYRDLFRKPTNASIADLCYTASCRRDHHPHRVFCVAKSKDAMAATLDDIRVEPAPAGNKGKVAFVYSGLGSGWAGMARGLFREEPVFARAVEDCERELRRFADWSLGDLLHETSWLDDAAHYHLALFVLQIGLTAVWRSWGIQADGVVGHGVGEIAAAHASGAIELGDALSLVWRRGHPPAESSGHGAMAATALSLRETTATSDELDAAPERLETSDRSVTTGRAQLDMYSTVTGTNIRGQSLSPSYWRRQVREPVCFAEATSAMLADGYDCFIEIGPHPSLLTDIEATAATHGAAVSTLASLRRGQDDRTAALTSLGGLYKRGFEIDWSRVTDSDSRCTSLPTYPWQRQRYWFDPIAPAEQQPLNDAQSALLCGNRIDTPFLEGALFESRCSEGNPAWLADYRLGESCVAPAAAIFEMALSAASEVLGTRNGIELLEGEILQPLQIPRSGYRRVQISVTPDTAEHWGLRIVGRSDGRDRKDSRAWHTIFECRARRSSDSGPDFLAVPRSVVGRHIDPTDVYSRMAGRGITLGPDFRALQDIDHTDDDVVATLRDGAFEGDYLLFPPHLDACFQGLEPFFPEKSDAWLPSGFSRLSLWQAAAQIHRAHARRRIASDSNPSELCADLTLFDTNASPCASIEGLRVRSTTSRPKRTGSREDHSRLPEVVWEPIPVTTADLAPARWLILADEGGIARRFAEVLSESGGQQIVIESPSEHTASEGLREIDTSKAADYGRMVTEAVAKYDHYERVVVLSALDSPRQFTNALATQRAICQPALFLLQALPHARVDELWLVTRGAQQFPEPTGVLQATLWGFGAAVTHEYPTLKCRLIDLDRGDTPKQQVDALYSEARARDSEDRVKWSGAERFAARLRIAEHALGQLGSGSSSVGTECANLRLRRDGTYLISGATAALTPWLARALVHRGARNLALVSRREADSALNALANELRSAGARVELQQADLTDAASLDAALTAIAGDMPKLRGVFHLAGVIDDGPIAGLSWERFERVLAPKVAGAWNLHLQTLHLPLDIFVLYSSVASIVGWPGQSSYSAGNAFMDALARYRAAEGRPALSINWGPWSDHGMAAITAARKGIDFAARGLKPFAASELSDRLLDELLTSPSPQRIVAWIDAKRLPRSSLTSEPGKQRSRRDGAVAGSPQSDPIADVLSAPLSRRPMALRSLVEQEASRILGLGQGFKHAGSRPLNELGLDSLLSVQLANALGALLKNPMPTTLLFDYPTIDTLTEHLLGTVAMKELNASAKTRHETKSQRSAREDLKQLSEADAEAQLLEELSASKQSKHAP